MKSLVAAILILFALASLHGCFVTDDYNTYSELRRDNPGSIRVMTRDTALYRLETYVLLDSAIAGTGDVEIRGTTRTFQGRIPYKEVVYVQGRSFSFFRTLVAVASTATAYGLVSYAGQEGNGLHIWKDVGGSCPYLYAWDGSRYRIQGETFGTAFGKALETTTSCMLPAAAALDGKVRLRLTNERPETHYVNSVSLAACPVPAGATVLLDCYHQPWAVRDPLPPRSTHGGSGKDILFRSDLSSTLPGKGFRDTLELTLPMPGEPEGGSFIVHAINTSLINAVYGIVFNYLGDQALGFLYDVEHNPDLIARLDKWIEECSLTVEVWKEGGWVKAGVVPPEANYVHFSKIVRINAAGMRGDSLRVRLTSLADAWQIDSVAIDWTASRPLPTTDVPLTSARHSATGPVTEALLGADSAYVIIFPGEKIDLTFALPAPCKGQNLAFFLKAGGYLYEGLQDGGSSVPELLASLGPNRIDVVKRLVRQRDIFLALVYDRWRELQKL